MSTVLKTISAAEYLARERQADFKSEFFQGETFAMAGGSPTHSLIAANCVGKLWQLLEGKPCKVFNSDLRVKVEASGLYTYPDASIVCGELQFDDHGRDTVVNPAVIIEVLSDSTEQYDRGRKLTHYRTMNTVEVILLVSQTLPLVECYTRRPAEGWLLQDFRALDAAVPLLNLGVLLPMSEIYRGVEFGGPETVASGPVV